MNKFVIYILVGAVIGAALAIMGPGGEDTTEYTYLGSWENSEALAADIKEITEGHGAEAKEITVNTMEYPGVMVLQIELAEHLKTDYYLDSILKISADVMGRTEENPEIGRVSFEFIGPMSSGNPGRYALLDGIAGQGTAWDPGNAINDMFEVRFMLPDLVT